MALCLEEFRGLCRLARLDPAPETFDQILGQCADILAYMDQLSQVDTREVKPMYSPLDQPTLYREDVAERRRSREEILAGAPGANGEFFVVPRIVEGK